MDDANIDSEISRPNVVNVGAAATLSSVSSPPPTTTATTNTTTAVLPTYPIPAYLKFAPGGVSFSKTNSIKSTKSLGTASQIDNPVTDDEANADTYLLAAFSEYSERSSSSSGGTTPRSNRRSSDSLMNFSVNDENNTSSSISIRNTDSLVHKAKLADDRLQSYIRLFVGAAAAATTDEKDGQKMDAPIFLPSLSVLANATFGRLTGVPPASAKTWADAMVLQYHISKEEESRISWPRTEEEVAQEKPAAVKHVTKSGETTVALLKRLLEDAPIFLPSLSVLANATFGRLTGVPPASAKTWADAMVLQYHISKEEESRISWPRTEEEVAQEKPAAVKHVTKSGETTVALLKRLLEEEHASEMDGTGTRHRRPCGYVFKRGDIAWNCRTCQTDSTCVICDTCFRNSNHDNHEVYFHRTTPGGCCDCGDAEAWKVEGCCDAHKPMTSSSPAGDDSTKNDSVGGVGEADPEEAVRMALQGRKDGIETLQKSPTKLPPRLAAALGVVIGAAVRCLVDGVDGAGVGADPVQWKLRWADEVCRIWNGAAQTEDYRHPSNNNIDVSHGEDAQPQRPWKTPSDFLSETKISPSFPGNYRLQLRLHNDDVHTFDEVIEALRSTNTHRNNNSTDESQSQQSLVPRREAATEMTHHVDADGQVPVKTYSSIQSAMRGYRRLKSRGLHCSVVSSAQIDMELRARHLSSWLAEISAAHPSAAVLVVHALLQIKSTQDLGGIAIWQEARTIPPWVTPDETDEIQACRRRFQSFPPHLASSYVTSDEAEKLHQIAMKMNANAFLEMTGKVPSLYVSMFSFSRMFHSSCFWVKK